MFVVLQRVVEGAAYGHVRVSDGLDFVHAIVRGEHVEFGEHVGQDAQHHLGRVDRTHGCEALHVRLQHRHLSHVH